MLFPVWALFNPSITVALKLKNWNRTQQKSQLSIKTVRLCHHSSLSNTMFHKPMTTCHVYCSSCADCCTGFPPHTSTQSSNNYISSSCSCWVCLQTARWAVKSTHISTITSKNLQRMALASNRSGRSFIISLQSRSLQHLHHTQTTALTFKDMCSLLNRIWLRFHRTHKEREEMDCGEGSCLYVT